MTRYHLFAYSNEPAIDGPLYCGSFISLEAAQQAYATDWSNYRNMCEIYIAVDDRLEMVASYIGSESFKEKYRGWDIVAIS